MANFNPTGYLSMAGFEAAKTASTIGLILAAAKLLNPMLTPVLKQVEAQGRQLLNEGLNELKHEMEVYGNGHSTVKKNQNSRGADVSEPIDIDPLPHGGHVFTPEE